MQPTKNSSDLKISARAHAATAVSNASTTTENLNFRDIYSLIPFNILPLYQKTDAENRATLDYWKPDGCIVEAAADNIKFPKSAFTGIPTVYLDCNPLFAESGCSCILQKPEAIAAAQVLELFPCSRCLAERRFRAIAGRSILEEIHAVQIEHAKKLIDRPFRKIESIPQLCGYSSAPFFLRLFRRETGMTMSEWRGRNRTERRIDR